MEVAIDKVKLIIWSKGLSFTVENTWAPIIALKLGGKEVSIRKKVGSEDCVESSRGILGKETQIKRKLCLRQYPILLEIFSSEAS